MTDSAHLTQCLECRIIGRPPLLHSCVEVTLQRAAIAAEQVTRARMRFELLFAKVGPRDIDWHLEPDEMEP